MMTEEATTGQDIDHVIMRWIDIKNGLPKPETNLVLVTRYGETAIAFWHNGKFLEEPMGLAADGVTAWMPLPPPAVGK